MRYIGKFKDPMSSAVSDHSAIEKEYSIFAGKLRRFHGKSPLWYLTQPGLVLRNIRDVFLLVLGTIQSVFILLFWRPKVIFVKGGYVGLPVGIAAVLLRIPIVTHDSDSLPGLTNRVLSRYAAALAVGAPVEQYPQYAGKNVYFTGVPVRKDFLAPPNEEEAKKQLGVAEYKDIIVVVGGSLGAVRVNSAIADSLGKIVEGHDDRALVWFTGAHSYTDVAERVMATGYTNVFVESYTNDLPTVFAAATVVITRAGATTLAELAVMKKPTIVIPNPLLTGGHQSKNAQMLAENNAVLVVSEDELPSLPEVLNTLLSDTELQQKLQTNFAKLANPNASQKIAEVVVQTAKGE